MSRKGHGPVLIGAALLVLVLAALCLWTREHLGWLATIVAVVVGPCALVWGLLTSTVGDSVRDRVTRALGMPQWHRRLAWALGAEIVLFGMLTSAQVSLDDGVSGPVQLTRGTARPGGDAPRTVTLKKGKPVRRFGMAFTKLPTYSTREQVSPGGRFRPYFLTRIGYPGEFDVRTTLILQPFGHFYLARQAEAFRVRVADSAGVVLADVVFGGPGRPGAITLGGSPAQRVIDAAVHRRLSEQESGTVTQVLDGSRPYLWAEPRRPLQVGERVAVEVWHADPGGRKVLSGTLRLADTTAVAILDPGMNP